jgi:hypothetical protein
MVELPGSLERSTLGDVLGALHRDCVSGALRLDEPGTPGRQHVIYWHDGLIHHIESTARAAGGATARIDAAWFADAPVESQRGDDLAKLEGLFELRRARISFRVMGRGPGRSAQPLEPRDFLHGRRRHRDSASSSAPPPRVFGPRQAALATLGLSGEPDSEAVRSAFRKLALRWHPDRYPSVGPQTRAALCRRFAEVSAAYRELIAEADSRH